MGYKVNTIYLTGAFFLVFIFGMLGSQQAMAGDGSSGNIIVDKFIVEGSTAGTALDPELVEKGDTVEFNIIVRIIESGCCEASVSSIMMNDLLPDGLTYVSDFQSGTTHDSDYDPDTGDWTISELGIEGSTSSLFITATVDEGACGVIENVATLVDFTDDTDNGGNTDTTDDEDSVFLKVVNSEDVGVNCRSSGSSGHEPPTIGKALDGVRQVVEGGISVDGQAWTVTQGYHQEFELLQMLSSPHTISNVIHCDKGVEYCNYIAVGFMALTDNFNNPVMTVSASKDHQGTWTLGWYDPDDYISDPSDAAPADIVFVPQIIDNKLLGTSFTIDFKNKDTGQLKLGIQVRDSYNGVRNFYFNEGVEFIDADAYPAVNAAYDEPIEVEPLCFGQNNPDRNSCAFAKIKDWATANAEDALRQMTNGEYEYEN